METVTKLVDTNKKNPFGKCPSCGGNEVTYHIGRYHYEACHSCQLTWRVGVGKCPNCIVDSYEDACSRLDKWEANKKRYGSYAEVAHKETE